MNNINAVTISGKITATGEMSGTVQITGEPVLDSVTVKSTGVSQTIVPEQGVDGYNEITVEPILLQSKSVTPGASAITVTPDSAFDGLSSVEVGAASGGEDTLNTLFNTPSGATPTPFTMTDDNANHICYGFKNGLNVTLGAGVKSFVNQAFNNDKSVKVITGQDIEAVNNDCFNSSVVKSVSFPKCTSIGNRAFQHCNSLSSINFPLCQTVGENAFDSCTAITTIDLPACTTIGKGAFGSMRYTSINVPICTSVGESALRDFKGQVLRLPAVQTMGREQFRYCENMTDLYLGYDGVVTVTREQSFFGWEMFPRLFSGSMTINVHVPAGQLANYQADATWTDIVTAAASDNVTVVFVGDYV